MLKLSETLHVDRTPAEVFDFIVNMENVPKWQPAVTRVTRLTDGPVRVGSQFREQARLAGRTIETTCEITTLESAKRFAFRASSTGPFTYESQYELAPAGAGTHLQIEGRFHFRGWWRLVEPLLAMEVRKESRQELAQMKAAIENAGGH